MSDDTNTNAAEAPAVETTTTEQDEAAKKVEEAKVEETKA